MSKQAQQFGPHQELIDTILTKGIKPTQAKIEAFQSEGDHDSAGKAQGSLTLMQTWHDLYVAVAATNASNDDKDGFINQLMHAQLVLALEYNLGADTLDEYLEAAKTFIDTAVQQHPMFTEQANNCWFYNMKAVIGTPLGDQALAKIATNS